MPSSDATHGQSLFSMVLCVALLLPLMLAAQTTESTLSGLIGSIKAQKEAALEPHKVERPQPDAKPKLGPPRTPIVWSIFGMNQAFVAVVVIDGKSHEVRSTDLPYRSAHWRVLSIDAKGLLVQGHGRRLWLPAPDLGTRPELFLHELGVPVPSSHSLELSDSGVLSTRLPLQAGPFSGSPAPSLNAQVLSGGAKSMSTSSVTGFSSAQVRASSLAGESVRGSVVRRSDVKNSEQR